MVAEMESMPDQRKREKRQRAKRENRGDRERGVFIVRFNGAFRGDDRTDAAHRRADRKQRRKFRLELEQASEKGHKCERPSDFDGYENQADAAEFQNVAQQKARAEQHNSSLQPEFIRSDSRPENFRNAHCIRNHQSENDGPQHVLDVRKRPMMRLGIRANILLQQFARIADDGEQ